MIEDLAKQAIEARTDLNEKLTIFANVLAQISTIMATAATELAPAIEAEQQATLAYIIELEKALNRQMVQ